MPTVDRAATVDRVEQERLEEIREFLAALGHELRNPLGPIVTALQLMRMRQDTATLREQEIIQRQVDQLVRLVDDLLDVSRVIGGRLELKKERVAVNAVLARAVQAASPMLEQRRHSLVVDEEPGLSCEADAVRLAQVVTNLLSNAARYTPVGGTVSLRAWRDRDRFVEISVTDNGVGMAPELLPHVFDLFFQGGTRHPDRSESGLGIGLTLVKHLVALHGGHVDAASAGPGQGSRFTVFLPGAVIMGRDAADAGADGSAPNAGRRVLVVDDNTDGAETLGTLIRASGHEVLICNDAASALESADSFQPQVALLDIGLPIVDGYSLAKQLRERLTTQCRFVAITGYGQESDRLRSHEAGFARHLVKPVTPKDVLDCIEGE